MNISTKAKKLTRILGTTFGLISVPLLSSLVLLNPAHAEGDETICNQSQSTLNVQLRATNNARKSNYGGDSVAPGDCQTIQWDGDSGLTGRVIEWIRISDENGPISLSRYTEGVFAGQHQGNWVRMRTGHVTVR